MTLPPSPPDEMFLDNFAQPIDTAEKMLKAQSEALTLLAKQFESPKRFDGPAASFTHSLGLLTKAVRQGGKVVISGMGKSHKIGSKLVATLHSFGIPASSLHPSDSLHGDLGQVHRGDIVILISASGNSPELSALLRHLPEGLPIICLTCNNHSPLAKIANGVVYAPILTHHTEKELYGLPAPTISTTLSLALGDALCISLYESLENSLKVRHHNFNRWHPGGAIGLANGLGEVASGESVVVQWDSVPKLVTSLNETREVDLWRSVALCTYVCANDVVYKAEDIIKALESNTDLSHIPGCPVSYASQYRGEQGLCIFRDNSGLPTGLVWD